MFWDAESPRGPPPPTPRGARFPSALLFPFESKGSLDGPRAIPVGEDLSLPILPELRLVSAVKILLAYHAHFGVSRLFSLRINCALFFGLAARVAFTPLKGLRASGEVASDLCTCTRLSKAFLPRGVVSDCVQIPFQRHKV